MTWVKINLFAVVATMSIGATHAFAQEGVDASRLVTRSAGIAGVAPVSIDLDAISTQRYALVIGNGDYANVTDLPNAVADSRLVAQTLRASGYTVSEHYDLDKLGFEAALRKMLYETEMGAEILVFYAGHGVQVGSNNYILPTDTNVTSINDLPFETVSLQNILALASSRARSVVAILDSCRDNPFPDKELLVDLDGVPASIRSGFNPQQSPINSLIVFSTAPGAVALDGDGDNSPFTTAMVAAINDRPEASFDDLLKDIRRNVYQSTNQLQLPWQSSSLVESVYLSRAGADTWSPMATETPSDSDREIAPIAISAILNPKVAVGVDLAGRDMNADTPDMSLVSHPSYGTIEVQRDGQFVEVPERTIMSGTNLEDLFYRPNPYTDLSVERGLNMVQDEFEVQSDNQRFNVAVNLDIDACDRLAGDYLDPEGVGIAVYPNELDPTAALEACNAAIARDPQNGRFYYQLGRAHLALGNLEQAETAYTKAQELGHTRALQGLGILEIAKVEATQGRLSGRPSDEALAFFAAGVGRGDPYAYHSLGLQLLRNPASPAEELQGFELLSRALELGHTFSMNALGLYFLDEAKDHYDPRRGLRYLQGSAARNDIYGIANLGFVYANGAGGEPKDVSLAMEFYARAADAGHPTAPTSLGRLYFSGDLPGGVDTVKAVAAYEVGLSRGDGWGGANAAWVIANRDVPGYTLYDAAALAAKAAALRNPSAQSAAVDVLASLSGNVLEGGAQTLMRDLGVEIDVDGNFGPASWEKLEALAIEKNKTIPQDRQERLIALAQIFWEQTRFRVDLY